MSKLKDDLARKKEQLNEETRALEQLSKKEQEFQRVVGLSEFLGSDQVSADNKVTKKDKDKSDARRAEMLLKQQRIEELKSEIKKVEDKNNKQAKKGEARVKAALFVSPVVVGSALIAKKGFGLLKQGAGQLFNRSKKPPEKEGQKSQSTPKLGKK